MVKRRPPVWDDPFAVYLRDQLCALDGLVWRPMFGSLGLYQHGAFCGIVHDGRFFLRTDERTRPAFVRRGMAPFQPSPRQTLKNYYEVPADILDDATALVEWVVRAAERE
ncbi:MAG: TfoX/Sxy family protein [Thermomicrobiales bacterium]|jgi:DNA transformation protein|nr:TfoX/Sxy family protein [Thermomicrobiales bacterium]